MIEITRRQFLHASAAIAAGWALEASAKLPGVPPGGRARQDAGVEVLNPLGRVPLSFFIDDSTCLANLGYFCMPQFAEAWPDRAEYKQPWRDWPREIPNAFLREFGEWCGEHGVRGKFSLVPYPACVGWLDRELPGWSRAELRESLRIVREVMLPRWDVTPEMVTHTRVIDIRTGRPMEEISSATMENSYPQSDKSADELAAYLAYALKILRNCDIPCQGITTPGGFGNHNKNELSLAVRQAVADVFPQTEIPFYFKYVAEGAESTQPLLEQVEGADTEHPRLTVNVPAGTGDWFGGWTGDDAPQGNRYANDDATAGRMVELIERGEPAVMLCHWAGLYNHGRKTGFEQFKRVATALHNRYADRTVWMKISEIARYWAAKGLTLIARQESRVTFVAPFACPGFTIRTNGFGGDAPPKLSSVGPAVALKEVARAVDLKPGTWMKHEKGLTACFDLPHGGSLLSI